MEPPNKTIASSLGLEPEAKIDPENQRSSSMKPVPPKDTSNESFFHRRKNHQYFAAIAGGKNLKSTYK